MSRDLLGMEHIARFWIRLFCRSMVGRHVRLRVHGLGHLPARGPVLIVSRHYHHFYDAAALMTVVARPVHFLVALDWVHGRAERRLMEFACRAARWPALLRPEQIGVARSPGRWARSVYRPSDVAPYLRRAVDDAVRLLREGRAVVVYPEAYPTIDPEGSTRSSTRAEHDDFLPFRPGFVRIVSLAQRDGVTCVPIVPLGVSCRRTDRWHLTMRFGEPIYLERRADRDRVAADVAATVRALSTA